MAPAAACAGGGRPRSGALESFDMQRLHTSPRWPRRWFTACTAAAATGLLAGTVQAAAPATGPGPGPGVAAALTPAPPSITSFVIDGGAAQTPDRDVNLSWTLSGPAATHFRVSESSTFPNQAWYPMPQTPSRRWTIGSAGEGPKTLYIQFMNDHGQSTVRSATIELRVPLAIQSYAIENGAAATSKQRVNVRWTHTGSFTHYRVGPDTGTDKPWVAASAAPAGGVDVDLFDGATPDLTTRTVRLELRRDNDSPVVAKAFIRYERPLVDKVLDKVAVRNWIQAAGGAQIQSLGGSGTCAQRLFEQGGDRWYVAEGGDASLRCQFSIFQGLKLAGRWTLQQVEVQLGHPGTAGIVSITDWKMPSSTCRFIAGPRLGTNDMAMALEVYHPGKLVNPTDSDTRTACLVQRITLRGPEGTNP